MNQSRKLASKIEEFQIQLNLVQHEFAEHETAKNKDFNDLIREISIFSQSLAKIDSLEKNNRATISQIGRYLEYTD